MFRLRFPDYIKFSGQPEKDYEVIEELIMEKLPGFVYSIVGTRKKKAVFSQFKEIVSVKVFDLFLF